MIKKYTFLLPRFFLLFFALGIVYASAYSKTEPLFVGTHEKSLRHTQPPHSLHIRTGIFNVKKYGARGNGETLDSHAINEAIGAAAEAGGGTVYFPRGIYLSGSIHLKSHITLYIGQGCIIEASGNRADYDEPEPLPYEQYQDFGHSHCQNSLIWGVDIRNIVITGPGRIYGKGLVSGTPEGVTKGLGDKAIALKNCHNVTLDGFSILHAGHFGILATGVDNLTIVNLLIDTNRDGINIDCCKNVRISNCSINSPWNDAICLKSSYALGYLKPTEDVTITNCMVTGGYREGTLLDGTFKLNDLNKPRGRIKFGTESNGGFKNITISNCVLNHCRGLALEAVDGGDLEDISIANITMRNIVNDAIFIRLGNRMRGPKGATISHLRRINISNMVIYNAGGDAGSVISGIPGHDIEDVSISNVRIVYKGGGTKKDAEIKIPEKEDAYPGHDMFGILPAFGFFIRHVKRIAFDNFHLTYNRKEERPPFVLEDVKEADFRFIKAEHEKDSPLFLLKKVADINLLHVNHYAEKHISESVEKTL